MAKRSSSPGDSAEWALRDAALLYPEVTEAFPWGHRAMKVKGKVFAIMASDGGEFSVSLKLPSSGVAALMFPFAAPTRYGLGKSGWVTSRFAARDQIPLPLLQGWLEESYRAIAPKTLVKRLTPVDAVPVKATKGPAKKTSKKAEKKTAKKKTVKKTAARR